MKRLAFIATILTTVTVMFVARAEAQPAYPERPVHLIVPYAAGGVTDVGARLIANHMGNALGQQVIVENRVGGGGIVGAEAAKRTTPDGYTLLYATASTHGLLPALKKTMPYDAFSDFKPIILAVRAPLAVVVRADSPFTSVDDLVKNAGGKPINFGSAGVGTTSHLVGLMLAGAGDADMAAIHYNGEAPMVQDLLAGETDFAVSSIIQPHVEAGSLRVLATTGNNRWFVFPDAPTLNEAGYPAEFSIWGGIMAPANTPDEIINSANLAVNEALKQPEVINALKLNGLEVVGGDPSVFGDSMHSYINAVREIGLKNNISLD